MHDPSPMTSSPLTEPELEACGERLGRILEPPAFVCLRGPLGAGKSVLARAIARGAGVDADMPSPTFNLVFRYAGAGGKRVAHLDLYRIEDVEEVWDLGWEELGAPGEVVLVEWPERAEALLPPDRYEIVLTDVGADRREVSLREVGDVTPLRAGAGVDGG